MSQGVECYSCLPKTAWPPTFWIPAGFAHGFVVLSDYAEFLYKTTDYWSPEHERCIRWDDPTLAISWPLQGEPLVSDKDRQGLSFVKAEHYST